MTTKTLHDDPLISRLLDPVQGPCLSILMPTHRTMPDAKQDPILLKDLCKEAEARLLNEHEARAVAPLLDELHRIRDSWDHQHNGDGLAIFVSNDRSEAIRLPFPIAARTVVDGTFATRDVIRARLGSAEYHVLVLGSKSAKLFHAVDDRPQGEVRDGFPRENGHYTTDHAQVNTARGQEEQVRQWYGEVDGAVQEALGKDARIVVACTPEHYPGLLGASRQGARYIGHVDGNHDRTPIHELIAAAWPVAYEAHKAEHLKDIASLRSAPMDLQVTTLGDIWMRTREGRGHMLFVERDLRIAAKREGDRLVVVNDPQEPGVMDDVIDEIIETQLHHGGHVRIVPNGLLADYKGIGLLLRY
ncbi:MAG: hypothetical protein KDB88_06895 [Flavobacteriales bacterium]|nr:hypothetical protein [Flavobacteriales bacterium]